MSADPQSPKVDERQQAILATLSASRRVRDGRWIKGAPSHVLAELLAELEWDDWRLFPASLVASLQEEVEDLRAAHAREVSLADERASEVARLQARIETLTREKQALLAAVLAEEEAGARG